MKTVEERLREVIAEELGVDPDQVTPDASFVLDLGADSLDTIDMVMAVEDEFGLSIPDEDAERLLLVKDAIAYVEANVRPRAAAAPGEPL